MIYLMAEHGLPRPCAQLVADGRLGYLPVQLQ
jgi:hypothetical protein